MTMNQALTWLDPLQFLNFVVMLLLADEAMQDATAGRIRTRHLRQMILQLMMVMACILMILHERLLLHICLQQPAYVIMDLDHPESLMQITIQLILMYMNALVANAATLNFDKEFAEAMICCSTAAISAKWRIEWQAIKASLLVISCWNLKEFLSINDIDCSGIFTSEYYL